MSTNEEVPAPVVEHGIEYWNKQKADEDGVLGGFGTGSLPRIESLGSRLFLLNLLPELCTVPSALKPIAAPPDRRYRALDVGAGVGRVTSDTLLPLVSDVVLLEPVSQFIQEALARGQATSNARWRGIADQTKSVTFVQGTLQAFDPSAPISGQQDVAVLGRVGRAPEGDAQESGFDVVWCQWCLGHLSDPDLILFLQRSRQALRGPRSLIVVKENCCSDGPGGEPKTVFDEDDSSLTRSDMAWKRAFESVGLRLVREQVQEGLPEGLYAVKMYALR